MAQYVNRFIVIGPNLRISEDPKSIQHLKIRGWLFAYTEILIVIGTLLFNVSYIVLRCEDYLGIYVHIQNTSHYSLAFASVLLLTVVEVILFIDFIGCCNLQNAVMYMSCLTMKFWLQKVW